MSFAFGDGSRPVMIPDVRVVLALLVSLRAAVEALGERVSGRPFCAWSCDISEDPGGPPTDARQPS